jgi:hypothetical protein
MENVVVPNSASKPYSLNRNSIGSFRGTENIRDSLQPQNEISLRQSEISQYGHDEEDDIPGYEKLINLCAKPFAYETGFYFRGKKTY